MKLSEIKQLNESEFITDHDEIYNLLSPIVRKIGYSVDENGMVTTRSVISVTHKMISKGKLKIQFKESGPFTARDMKLTTLEGCPSIVNGSFDVTNNDLTSLDFIPSFVHNDISIEGCPIRSLVGIADNLKGCNGKFLFTGSNVTKGGLGLLLVKGLIRLQPGAFTFMPSQQAFKIINSYIRNNDNHEDFIYDCQTELVANDLEDFAEL